MAVLSARRAQFYLAAYPRLLRQLDRLVEVTPRNDRNIASIVLFGATVRLHPLPTSSANLLFSVYDVDKFLFAPRAASHQPDEPLASGCMGVQLVRGLQQAPGDGWQLSGVVSDLDGADLGPAMLRHIAQEGVLLYTDGSVPLAQPLRRVRDAALWRADLDALLAKCRKVLADDALLERQPPHDGAALSRSVVWDLDLDESSEHEQCP
jgi:hypothetical protein